MLLWTEWFPDVWRLLHGHILPVGDTNAIWGFETVRAVFSPVPCCLCAYLKLRIDSHVLARGSEPIPDSALGNPTSLLGDGSRSTERITEDDVAVLV